MLFFTIELEILFFFFCFSFFIDIQVGTIATGLETAEYKVERRVSAATAVECTRRSGEAKAVGKASQGQDQKPHTLIPYFCPVFGLQARAGNSLDNFLQEQSTQR